MMKFTTALGLIGLMATTTGAQAQDTSACLITAAKYELRERLVAQTLAESGGKPWAVTIDGKTQVASSKEEAVTLIQSATHARYIEAGCYQLSVRFHLHASAFAGDLSAFMDPAKQTEYVAQHPEWLDALQCAAAWSDVQNGKSTLDHYREIKCRVPKGAEPFKPN